MKNIKKVLCLLIPLLFLFGLLGWCLYSSYFEKDVQNKMETTVVPTPTKYPDAALPTLWMNEKLYRVDAIEKNDAVFEKADFVGTVESEVGYNESPKKEMESNILPVGTPIYKHQHSDDIYIAVAVFKSGSTYYYRIYEKK